MSVLTHITLILSVASSVYGHGRVVRAGQGSTQNNVGVIDYNNTPPKPIDAGWATKQTDLGFIDSPGSNEMACHRQAVSGTTDLPATAGSSFSVYWDHPGSQERFPESHHGAILTYLAKCPGTTCVGVSPTDLRFFKIQESGLITPGNIGYWAVDKMLADNGTVTFVLPKGLTDGAYVLRNEIIALHSAAQAGGAQFYPQCINIKVTGGTGSLSTSGVAASTLYKATDPGVLFNVWKNNAEYKIPGPAVVGDSSASPAPAPAPAPASAPAPAPPGTAATSPATTPASTLKTSASPVPSSGPTVSTKPLPPGTTLQDLAAWLNQLVLEQKS